MINQSHEVVFSMIKQTPKMEKLAYKVSFTITNSNVNYKEYRYSWVYPTIMDVLWQDEDVVAIVHEQNDNENNITALIVLRDTQPEPSIWLPPLLEKHLDSCESLENLVEIKVPDNQFKEVKNSIVSKIPKLTTSL
jgi:hypothetical protein